MKVYMKALKNINAYNTYNAYNAETNDLIFRAAQRNLMESIKKSTAYAEFINDGKIVLDSVQEEL